MFIRTKISILLLYLLRFVYAQDVPFSQIHSSPIALNSAETGLFNGKMRLVSNYKNQWGSVSTPFVSTAIAGDMKLFNRKKLYYDQLGVGIILMNNKSGDAILNDFKTYFTTAYQRSLDIKGRINFSLGIQAGINHRTFDVSKLTFPDQFDGRTFDASLPTGEEGSINNNLLFGDIGFGGLLFLSKKGINKTVGRGQNNDLEPDYTFGFNISQINNPKENFLTYTEISRQKPIYLIHGSMKEQINTHMNIYGKMMFKRERTIRDFNIGADLEYFVNNALTGKKAVYGGLRLRTLGTGVIITGIKYANINFAMSYDINFSELKVASAGKRGLEFSINYSTAFLEKSIWPKFWPGGH